jgi:capsule polysaccharide export protein KpsE/RkpR
METTQLERPLNQAWQLDSESPKMGQPNPQRSETLMKRIRTLWSSRRILAFLALAGLLLGTLLAFIIPKKFQSTTQLMPPNSGSGSGMAMLASLGARPNGGLAASASDLLGIQTSGALFIGILRSQTVEDRVISKFDLKSVYGQRYEARARRELEENTEITEDRKSGIITITATDHDPNRAAAIAQTYVDELNQVVSEASTGAAHRERMFLEDRLQNIKRDLDNASQALSQFSSKNNAIDIQEQGRAMVGAAATLQGQLIAAESELQGLRQIYAADNPRVREMRARADELKRQLDQMAGNANGKSGSVANDSLYPSIRQLPILGATYSELYRNTKIEETIYESLSQEYELAKVEEAKETPSVKILDVAQVPERKSYPPRLEIIVLCSLLALMGGAILVLGRAQWDEVDSCNDAKVLAREILESVTSRLHLHRRASHISG